MTIDDDALDAGNMRGVARRPREVPPRAVLMPEAGAAGRLRARAGSDDAQAFAERSGVVGMNEFKYGATDAVVRRVAQPLRARRGAINHGAVRLSDGDDIA